MALAATPPVAAQSTNTTAPATNNSAATTGQPAPAVVGPRELRDFSLGGTVTRRAEPATGPAPAPAASAPAPRATAPRTTAPRTERDPASEPSSRPAAGRAPARSPAGEPATTSPIDDQALTATPVPPQPPEPGPVSPEVAAPLPGGPGNPSWPWLLAGLALAGAVGWLWRRRRQAGAEPAYAGASEALFTPAPAAAPVARPVPKPAPRVPKGPLGGGGIVARSLEPKLGFEFTPLRAEFTPAGEAALLFDLVVVNAGGAPARQVLVEGKLLNAGADLDVEVAQFFQSPVGLGDRIPVIMPQARVSVRSRVLMTADRLKPVEIDGRQLLVPVIAFNALYKSSGADRQVSASFLIGRGGEDGGKMGPLPIDRGPRSWDGLGQRPHSAGLNR